MSDLPQKIVAIYPQSHTTLKSIVDEFKSIDFHDISVLVKPESEIRMYSSSPTRGGTATQQRPAGQPLERDLNTQTHLLNRDREQYAKLESREQLEKLIANDDDLSSKDPNALLKDSAIGGVIGALVGAGALLVPGIGTIFAAGTLGTALGALATGGAAGVSLGTLVGVLQDEGLPQERVAVYRNAFESGQMILVVNLDKPKDDVRAAQIMQVLNHHQPDLIDSF